MNGKAAVLIGSESNRDSMEAARKYFEYFDIEMDLRVMSAHRNPNEVSRFASSARNNGYHVLIGAAGMAAHLAGALKAHSTLPVIGVPIASGPLSGFDALLSTAMMPPGVPVAAVAVGEVGATNAAILAVQILATADPAGREKIEQHKREMAEAVEKKNRALADKLKQSGA